MDSSENGFQIMAAHTEGSYESEVISTNSDWQRIELSFLKAVTAIAGAASGALASTGVPWLSGYAGQIIGNGAISFAESAATDFFASENVDNINWGKAAINGLIGSMEQF